MMHEKDFQTTHLILLHVRLFKQKAWLS